MNDIAVGDKYTLLGINLTTITLDQYKIKPGEIIVFKLIKN